MLATTDTCRPQLTESNRGQPVGGRRARAVVNRDAYNAWLAGWIPRPVRDRTYRPAALTPWSCPTCGAPASLGVRWGGLINVKCDDHGTWYAQMPFRFSSQEFTEQSPRPATMTPETRLWFLHAAAQRMTAAPEGAFIVADVQGRDCEYAILDHAEGHGLALQLNGREWDCPVHGNAPLSLSARRALAHLDFAAPGPRLNPWREHLHDSPRDLAVLMERALVAAYDPPLDFEIALYAGDSADSLALMDTLMPPLDPL